MEEFDCDFEVLASHYSLAWKQNKLKEPQKYYNVSDILMIVMIEEIF